MLLLLAAEVLLGVSAATPRGRPAILMMLADDWGSYDASWRMKELGRTPDILTPHIDELSAGGVRFSNYYVQPICTPTRSVLMSGRYSIHTGCEHILFGASEPSCLPTEFPIMPEAFKKIGYQTHMAGKWHLGYYNDSCAPWSRGFDSYLGYLNGVEGYYAHGMGPYMDFHECANDTDSWKPPGAPDGSGVAAAAAGVMAGGGGYKHELGAMPVGHDVVPPQNATFAQATALCDAHPSCDGFTFESTSPQPFMPVKTFFKSAAEVSGDATWQSWLKADLPPPKTCDQCTVRYEGQYSTHVYTQHVQGILESHKSTDRPLFLYMAWQAVHEPMQAPDSYIAPYTAIKDASRRIYAGMLSALDEGIGNITQTLKDTGLYENSVVVLSNDNGGMSGSYGLGCCNCGTSCGGLNYPYRGWKDSFWEGGFRGIGFVHSPLLAKKGTVYAPLVHVSDWYRTLLGAALSGDSAAARSAAQKQLAPLLAAGAIDSVDQWAAISAGASASLSDADPRTEVLLAGIDSDKHGAAIRVGAYKLLIGDWGADTWCDLNVSGLSPAYPAPARSQGSTSIGGEGGLVCVHLNGSSRGSSPPARTGEEWVQEQGHGGAQLQLRSRAHEQGAAWWNTTKGLYDVVKDPREMNDLQATMPAKVAELLARFMTWNATRVGSIHAKEDPAGKAYANATNCWSPWQGK